MNQPTISIVIPVYNVEKYLDQCLNSILQQEYKDFEVILVDDGSTDNSGNICDQFAKIDYRFKVIHKENEGVSIARNIGIQQARGKWISFIDSDDWIEKYYLTEIFTDTQIADLTFWGSTSHYSDQSKTIYIPSKFISKEREEILEKLYKLKQNDQKFQYFGYTWNKLFRTDIIKDNHILFIPHLTIREDEIFTLTYAKYIRSINIKNISIYNYRVNISSLTHSKRKGLEYFLYSQNVLKEIKEIPDTNLSKLELTCAIESLITATNKLKIFSPEWHKATNLLRLSMKKRILNRKEINSKKIKILSFTTNYTYFYIVITLLSIISKRQ